MKPKIKSRPASAIVKSLEYINKRLNDAAGFMTMHQPAEAEDAMKDVRRAALKVQRDFRLAKKGLENKRRKANKE